MKQQFRNLLLLSTLAASTAFAAPKAKGAIKKSPKAPVSVAPEALEATSLPTGEHEKAPQAVFSEAKKFNLRIDPLSFLIGFFNATFDVGVSDRISVGPQLGFWNFSLGDTKLTAFTAGVRANFFLTGPRFVDGWYVGPYFSYVHSSVSNASDSVSINAYSIGALMGYLWVWPSGFNMGLGFGGSYNNVPSQVVISGSTTSTPGLTGVRAAIEWTMGMTF